MKKVLGVLKEENMILGYTYFYIHFVVEVLCFFSLERIYGNGILIWLIPLFYDMFAFIPQGIIGFINDKYQKLNVPLIGAILLILGFVLLNYNIESYTFVKLFIMCIGNCFLHIAGAEATLRTSHGKMASSAIFVSGGSFGLVIGKLLGKGTIPYVFVTLLAFSIIPLIILSNKYRDSFDKKDCKDFNYAKKINPYIVILVATLVVIVRGYIGYGIPTTWNKTVIQTILLYTFMSTGKALGGILIDTIGMKKTAIISTLCSIPFLVFGDNIMIISLIGIMFFSMTMAITLGLLVSVLKNKPGLAFGYTTLGLFLGTVPIFFIKITNFYLNISLIAISSVICLLMLLTVIKGDKYD